MSEKISDYVADATSNPIKNEDYLDFSNEDGLGGYNVSKKILVSEFLAFIPTVKLGKSLFVSSEGVTIADGALRESLTKHFLTMAEAESVAIAGDTIYVYGDQTPNTNIYKDGVVWEFMGSPTITNNQALFNDGGVAGTCIIRGNASFNCVGGVFNFSGVGTVLDIECRNAITTTGVALQVNGSVGVVSVSDTIQSSSGATLYITGNTNMILNAKNIIGLKSNGLTVNVRSEFIGKVIINANLITASPTSATSSVIFIDGTTYNDAEIIFNVSDKVHLLGSGATSQAVRCENHTVTVNGDIDGGQFHAIRSLSPAAGTTFYHNGNAWNDGSLELVSLAGANAKTTNLNGVYTSANARTIFQSGAGNTLFISGRIVNTNALAVVKSGVFMNTRLATLFNNVVIIMDLALGTPTCVDATSPITGFKVLHSLGTNSGASANVSNLIPGAIFNVDLDYQ